MYYVHSCGCMDIVILEWGVDNTNGAMAYATK